MKYSLDQGGADGRNVAGVEDDIPDIPESPISSSLGNDEYDRFF